MIIAYHKEYIPAFGLPGIPDQMAVCRVVVLSLGESKRDCAAYEGIVKSGYTDADLELVRAGGNKVSKTEAADLFTLHYDGVDLMYRR